MTLVRQRRCAPDQWERPDWFAAVGQLGRLLRSVDYELRPPIRAKHTKG